MSSMAGLNTIAKLGLSQKSLIPVTTQMKSADNSHIKLLGATFIELQGKNSNGDTITTKQMVYITPNTEAFYLSRKGCEDLGIISNRFPTIGDVSLNIEASLTSDEPPRNQEAEKAECGCLKRTLPPPITKPPYPLNDENREKIEKFLVNHYRSSTFNMCTHQELPKMKGPPMHIMINSAAKPVAIQKAIPVPLHYEEQVKLDLQRDVRLGVIEKVPAGTPTTWCSRMIVCSKKDSKPRRTVDYQQLNKHAIRETHSTPSPYNIARQIPRNVKKSTCDAWNGYHSIPLYRSDSHYTTFITPWGRYRYLRCPQGYVASGDAYTSRYDTIVENVERMAKCVDDSILWSDTTEESFHQVAQYLHICGTNGIILNESKFHFAKDQVEFAGFQISNDSVAPIPTFLKALEKFPTPNNITDIRSWFGLVNQAAYSFSKTEVMAPFRCLLKKNSKFVWNEHMETAFRKAKEQIAKEITKGIKIFERNRTTCLATDWSKSGIGAWLLQKHCVCDSQKPFCCPNGWQVTLFTSRYLTETEARYSPVEGEALAVVYGLEKTKHFILGIENLMIAVDHKPLIGLFTNRNLEDISNPRLRNLKEKTLQYRFTMTHVDGVRNKVADCLSRHPSDPAEHMELIDDPTTHTAQALHDQRTTSTSTALTIEMVANHTTADPAMKKLLNMAEEGFPNDVKEMPEEIRAYHKYRDNISSKDGVVTYKHRVIIPPALRQTALETLHSAHQGTSQMTSRATECIFWPGITNDIATKREECMKCHAQAPSNPDAPPQTPTVPEYPFQHICADFFSYKGTNYLIIVDRFSGWPTVKKTNGAQGVITSLREIINNFGIPEEITSDGGPELSATSLKQALQDWGIHHRISSVAHARSNGRAEVAVKSMKRLLVDNTGPHGGLDSTRFLKAMLQYKNTPDAATGISPAMYVFHRPLKDYLPKMDMRTPEDREETAARHQEARRQHLNSPQPRLYEHTRRLPALQVGDRVFVQNQSGPHPNRWDNTGVIIEVKQFDQYVVKMDSSGRHTLRNRKFLRKYMSEDPYHLPLTIERNTREITNPPQEPQSPDNNTAEDTIAETPGRVETTVEPPDNVPKDKACKTPAEQTEEREIRRSSRSRKQPDRLNYNHLGTPREDGR